eukprot:4292081-Pyramimonas_sp.AAC.1
MGGGTQQEREHGHHHAQTAATHQLPKRITPRMSTAAPAHPTLCLDVPTRSGALCRIPSPLTSKAQAANPKAARARAHQARPTAAHRA